MSSRSSDTPAGSPVQSAGILFDKSRSPARTGRPAQISWEWHPPSNELCWSENLRPLLGSEPYEHRPRLPSVVSRVFARDRAKLERARAAALGGGPIPSFEIRLLGGDGEVRHLWIAAVVNKDTAGRVASVTGLAHDVTDARLAEQRLAARHAVSHALAQWTTLKDGAAHVLRALGTTLRCEIATLWLPNREVLVPAVSWSTPRLSGSEFERATLRMRVPKGIGLAGTAWQRREPVDLTTVKRNRNYPRLKAAQRAGLKTAVALPAVADGEVLAVIDLHVREKRAIAEPSMLTLRGLGYEIGSFLAQHRGQLVTNPLTRRELEILQLAADGLSAPEIATRLTIERSTVKTHLDHIYRKLRVRDRVAAVAQALRAGLIE